MKSFINFCLLIIIVLDGIIPANAQSDRTKSKSFDALIQKTISNSTPQLSALQLSTTLDKYYILDAREPKEYKVSHLPKAKYVGYDNLDLSALKGIPLDQSIVVYCSIGYRSEKVSEKIMAKGYKKVYNLYGGIFEWKNQGYTVVNNAGSTEEVHAYSKVWGVWLNKGKKIYN